MAMSTTPTTTRTSRSINVESVLRGLQSALVAPIDKPMDIIDGLVRHYKYDKARVVKTRELYKSLKNVLREVNVKILELDSLIEGRPSYDEGASTSTGVWTRSI